MVLASCRECEKENARLLQVVHDTRLRYEADHSDQNRTDFMQAVKDLADFAVKTSTADRVLT
jgi:hypothetical protein